MRLLAEKDVQAHKSFLRKRVSRNDVLFRRWPHELRHVICEPDGNVKQARLPGGPIVVHSRFDQRAGVVHFVLPEQEAAVQTPLMARFFELGVGIDVTVRIPGGRRGNPCDVAVQPPVQFRVGMRGKKIG